MTFFISIRVGGFAAGIQSSKPFIGIDEAPDDGAQAIVVMAGVLDEGDDS